MREAGVEPARAEAHKILSLARLPIPPLPHTSREAFVAPTYRQVKDLWAVSGQPSAFGPERPSGQEKETADRGAGTEGADRLLTGER